MCYRWIRYWKKKSLIHTVHLRVLRTQSMPHLRSSRLWLTKMTDRMWYCRFLPSVGTYPPDYTMSHRAQSTLVGKPNRKKRPTHTTRGKKIRRSRISVDEDSESAECDAVSQSEWLLTFRRNVGSHSPPCNTASCPRISESIRNVASLGGSGYDIRLGWDLCSSEILRSAYWRLSTFRGNLWVPSSRVNQSKKKYFRWQWNLRWAGTAQSVQRPATGLAVRGSNPDGGEIFRTRPDRPWGPPSLLYNGYRVFPGGKAAGPWRWPATLNLGLRLKKE